jgi:hypothetical protein
VDLVFHWWFVITDELWNLYLDFCIQRLSQSLDSNKNEVRVISVREETFYFQSI